MLMTRERLIRAVAFAAVSLALLHITALWNDLYWRFWWLDLLAHFCGGVFIALLLLWFSFFSGYTRCSLPSRNALFLCMVGGALAVGVGWEVFERLLGLSWSPEGYWTDTLLDLFMDAIGALAAYLFIRTRL